MRLPKNELDLKTAAKNIERIKEEEGKHSTLEKLQGKKAYMVFGGTGAKKTTFLLSLTGKTLEQEGSVVICTDAKDDDIGKIGNTGHSETVGIHAKEYEDELFVDTAGITDSAGPSMDIANVISVHRGLKCLKSVVPILVIPFDVFGVNRAEPMIELLDYFSGLFSNDEDALGKAVFVVSVSCLIEDIKAIEEAVLKAVGLLRKEEFSDSAMALLNNFFQGLKKKKGYNPVIIWQPFLSNTDKILLQISKAKPIKLAEAEFCAFPPRLRKDVEAKLAEMRTNSRSYAEEGEIGQLKDILFTLRSLTSCIPPVQETFSICIKEFNSCILKNQSAITSRFIEILQTPGLRNNDDIRKIDHLAHLLEQLIPLSEYLSPEIYSREDFVKFVDNKLQEYYTYACEETDFVQLKCKREKLHDFTQNINIECKPEQLLLNFSNVIGNKVNKIVDCIKGFQLPKDLTSHEDIAKELKILCLLVEEIHRANRTVSSFIDLDFTAIINDGVKGIVALFQNAALQFRSAIDSINSNTVEQLKSQFLVFKVAKCHLELLETVGTENKTFLKELYNEVKNFAVECGQAKISCIKDCDIAVKALLEPLKLLCSLDNEIDNALNQALSLLFNRLSEDISRYTSDFEAEFEKESPDVKKLYTLYQRISKNKWMDEYPANIGRIQFNLTRAQEWVIDICKGIIVSQETELRAGKYESIVEKINQLTDLAQLARKIPEVRTVREQALQVYTAAIHKLLDDISTLAGSPAKTALRKGDEEEKFSFIDAGKKLRQISAISDVANNLELGEKCSDAEQDVRRYLKRKCDELAREVSNESIDYRIFEKVLLILMEVYENKNLPEDIQKRYIQVKGDVISILEEEFDAINGDLNRNLVDSAEAKQKNLHKARPLGRMLGQEPGPTFDLLSSLRDTDDKLYAFKTKTVDNIPHYFASGQLFSIQKLMTSSDNLKEGAENQLQHEYSKTSREVKRKIDSFLPLIHSNSVFNVSVCSEILEHLNTLSECKIMFTKQTHLFGNPSELDTYYVTLDQKLSDAVREIENLRDNGSIDVANSIHRSMKCIIQPQQKLKLAMEALDKYYQMSSIPKGASLDDLNNLYKKYEKSQQATLVYDVLTRVTNEIIARLSAIESKTSHSEKIADLENLELEIKELHHDLQTKIHPRFKLTKQRIESRSSQQHVVFGNALLGDNISELERLYEEAKSTNNNEVIQQNNQLLQIKREKLVANLEVAIQQSAFDEMQTLYSKYQEFAKVPQFSGIFRNIDELTSIKKLKAEIKSLIKNASTYSSFGLNSEFPPDYFEQIGTILKVTANTNFVSSEEVLIVVKPVKTILTEIDDFVVKGKAQFNFQLLTKACSISKNFSNLIDLLQQINLSNEQFVELKKLIEKVKPYNILTADIKEYVSSLSVIIKESWEVKRDCTPMERCMQSITAGHLAQLGTYVDGMPTYEMEITRASEHLYTTILKASESALTLSKDVNKCFADLKKLEAVEGFLGLSGSRDIEGKLCLKVEALIVDGKKGGDVASIANSLTSLQNIADEIPILEKKVKTAVEEVLEANYSNVDLIGGYLESNPSRFGNMLISAYPHFAAKKRDLWIKKTAGQTIEKAVDSFKISEDFGDLSLTDKIAKLGVDCMSFFGITEREKLVKDLKSFESQFKQIIETNKYQPDFQGIADRARELCTRKTLQKIPEILANVLAVWSLLKSNISTTSRNKDAAQSREFWYQPHAVQVLTLLRMLESKNSKFINQLVQILTGEGKSVVLGTLSIVFALRGIDVHCICYSSYLSKRDYRDFQPVFEKFGVIPRIRYSTISEMCEYFINSRGNIRELTSNFIDSSLSPNSLKKDKMLGESILLIDEVDVFFGADFYGDTFNPATRIQGDDVYEVMKFIWSNKLSVNLQQVVSIQPYKNLLARFPTWERLLRSEISQMLVQVSDFMFGNPLPLNNRVGYAVHGETSFNIAHGYRTAFAYFHYNETGDIDSKSVKNNIGINVICGAFSYAKIPRQFTYVMGVSGTLSNLTDIEKQILCSYGISRVALAPSMYGESRRKFNPGVDVTVIEDRDAWLLNITQSAKDKIEVGKAVIVIFPNELIAEYKSAYSGSFEDFEVLDEISEFKDNIVARASKTKMMTVIARPFARGSDFSCQDNQTIAAGGVHVIQTFLSESAAEHIQAQGRCARQGEPGSYEMIIWQEELINYGLTAEQIKQHKSDGKVHELLSKTRDTAYEKMISGLLQGEKNADEHHTLTTKYHNALINYSGQQQDSLIQDFILKFNVTSAQPSNYHIYFCLDDSGSMSSHWNSLIAGVKGFCDRRIQMCNKANAVASDLVTIVNYSDTATIMCSSVDINSQPETKTRFRSGGTDFKVGLNLVYTEIAKITAGYQPVVVFMSDGGSSTGDKEIKKIAKDYKAKNIDIFLLGFGSGCNSQKLKNMAKISGGQYFFGSNAAQLKEEFEAISTQISKTIAL